jgi:hypothetical protein
MTILLVLRNEIGDTDSATDGYVSAISTSTPTVVTAFQHNIATTSTSDPVVTITIEQTIETRSVSTPIVTFEVT